jgi:tetratricopeptide (TPR) repeat protein
MIDPARLLDAAAAALDFGQAEEALGYLDVLLTDAPCHDEALRLRAAVLARMPGRAADALADCARIAQPTQDDQRLRARLLAAQGDHAAAAALLRVLWAAHRSPADADGLAHLYLTGGSRDDLRALLALLDDLPPSWNWQIVRGDALAALGNRDAAAVCYAAARAAVTDPALIAYLTDRITHLAS